MFEIEIADRRLKSTELPPDVRASFLAQRSITHLGHIQWEEHCTECSWPTCYTTCDLYNPRNDGHCRRTIDGFSPLADTHVFGGPVVRVKFKRWGNLHAQCQVLVYPVEDIERRQGRLNSLSMMASRFKFGGVIGWPGLPSRLMRRVKTRSVAQHANGLSREPNCFVMEIHNPAAEPVSLSLTIASPQQAPQYIPFKRLLQIDPGFRVVRIPFEEIRKYLAGRRDVFISVNPNILQPEQEGLTLYFGVMNFAYDPSLAVEKIPSDGAKAGAKKSDAKKIKIVIWDLDNTVWNGTLIEGAGSVTLKPGVADIIKALDSRGIVNSVASKNHARDAFAELERLGLREYFVFPAISWGPKSEGVRQIIQSFNVGEDTIAFVDDQPFEREEVRAGNPKVRCYRHDEVAELLSRDEFKVPVTDEARSRRSFYQNEEVRQQAIQSSGNYIEFLKQSNIRVHIARASIDQIERIHELVQRTNQMNFSGNRYTKETLRDLLSSPRHECYLIDAEDNYGKYGYIGFAVMQPGPAPRVVDLAFSCRVQSKRVEHAVLGFLMEHCAKAGASDFEVFYRSTPKNAQIAEVFPDLEFSEVSRQDNDFVYGRSISGSLPGNDVVTVTVSAPARELEPVAS